MGLSPTVSTTTSNLIIGVMTLAGASVYLANGVINPALVVPMMTGIVRGMLAGARLLVILSNQNVRKFLLTVLLVL